MKQEQPEVAHELRDPAIPPVRGLQSGMDDAAPRTVRTSHTPRPEAAQRI